MKTLRTPCPPAFEQCWAYTGTARYLAIYYAMTDARWTDGRNDYPWSFWLYSACIEHPAISVDLTDADLGSDDSQPSHWLMIDRQERTLHLGTVAEVRAQLEAQHPPRQPLVLTDAQWEALTQALRDRFQQLPAPSLTDLEAMRAQVQCQERELLRWLDRQLTPDIVQAYQAYLGPWSAAALRNVLHRSTALGGQSDDAH